MMLTPGLVGGIGFRPIAKARAMACGSNPRALPDLMAAASAADPKGEAASICIYNIYDICIYIDI